MSNLDLDLEMTYLLVDGENIDATLGMSILGRKPNSEERPRWDSVLKKSCCIWKSRDCQGLFFLREVDGELPMGFVQALMAMHYRPIPLTGSSAVKITDTAIKRTLDTIANQGCGNVVLVSHDGDFVPQLQHLLDNGHKVAVVCLKEYLSSAIYRLADYGLEIYDLEYDFHAFQVKLPRVSVIDLDDYDPREFL